MGQAIQAQCIQSDVKAMDFQLQAKDLNDISAVIDFSSPEGFVDCVNVCIENASCCKTTHRLSSRHTQPAGQTI